MSNDNKEKGNRNSTALDKSNEDNGNALTRRDSEVGFSLEPKNLQEALKVCEYLARSSMVPKQYQGNPADILVAINFGQEVGLKPLQSLNSVAVVNGSPGLWGDAPLALCKQHGDFEWILEDNEAFAYARDNVKGWEHLKDVNKDDTSICVVKRKGEPPAVREFSKEDVSKAKLGNVHNTYPKIMRRYRARSQALKAAFPDVLKGFEQAEIQKETQKMIDEGTYDDLNTRTEVPEQPADRQEIDFEENEDSAANGAEPKSKAKEQAEKPATEGEQSDTGGSEAVTSDHEQLMADVNALGKDVHGSDWYRESKVYVANYDESAENLLDLDEGGLKHIKRVLESKAEKQEA